MTKIGGRILVVRGGAIGDFVVTLPVLAALRERFPHAYLEVLGYPHIAQLAQMGGLADAVSPIESRAMAGFFASGGPLDQNLARYFSQFDLILSYLFDPDRIFKTNVAHSSRAQFIQGPHRPSEGADKHATDLLLEPLEQLAIFEADPVPRLRLRFDRDFKQIGQIGDERGAAGVAWWALHPGSGSERKNWPEDHWAAFLPALIDMTRFNILLVGGEAEGDRLTRLAAATPSGRVRIARSLPLVELACWLKQCRGFIGHDSGISHLAAALGLGGLILWGDSSETVWAPRSETMELLHAAQGLDHLAPAVVLAKLLEFSPPHP